MDQGQEVRAEQEREAQAALAVGVANAEQRQAEAARFQVDGLGRNVTAGSGEPGR